MVEHQGVHVMFLNLDITIKKSTLICKLIDRDLFRFSILKMPYQKSNNPKNIFHSIIKGEFFRIACSALCLKNFIIKAKELSGHTKQYGSKHNATRFKIISETFREFPTLFIFHFKAS